MIIQPGVTPQYRHVALHVTIGRIPKRLTQDHLLFLAIPQEEAVG
jgi:hypothetical protein